MKFWDAIVIERSRVRGEKAAKPPAGGQLADTSAHHLH